MSVCPEGGLANRRVDGAWVEVPCDPDTPWVCWSHKMKSMRGAIRNGRDPVVWRHAVQADDRRWPDPVGFGQIDVLMLRKLTAMTYSASD